MRVFHGLEYVHLDGDAHPIPEILGALAELVQEGKLRFIGLSNETPWGLMTFLKAADEHGLSRIVSIQNAYNLVNRTFEIGLSEVAQRENVSLLGYSPLGQGYLTGKYEGGALPPGSRKTLFNRLGRYEKGNGPKAISACRACPQARPRPGANGDRFCSVAPVCDEHHYWCHHAGAAQYRHRSDRA